jgi:hypothetical protein
MQYFGMVDLLKRWPAYGRRGIEYWRKRDDFPKPTTVVNDGHTPLWSQDDIARFEQDKPELFDKAKKRRKVARFAVGNLKKKARLQAEAGGPAQS